MLPSVDVQSTTEPYQEIANDLNIDNVPNCAPDNDHDNSTKFVAFSIFRFMLSGIRAFDQNTVLGVLLFYRCTLFAIIRPLERCQLWIC